MVSVVNRMGFLIKQIVIVFTCCFIMSTPLLSQVNLESSNLPIVIINTNGQVIPDEPKIEVDMGIIYNGPGQINHITDNYNDYDGVVGIELRGSTSMSFPKKSYTFETRDTTGNNLNVSLIDFPEENDWILYAPYSDKSLMRNVLIYQLSNNMGRYASRTRYCELMLNGEYVGVYVLMEKIKQDENRVNIANLTSNDTIGDELTGGYIVKLDRHNGDGWYSKYNDHNYYEYYYPDDDDILDCQKQYIESYFTDFEDLMFGMSHGEMSTYNDIINVSSFVDHLIINEFAKNIDAYRLSSYFSKDKGSNDGRLNAGPVWDFNISLGNCNYYFGYEVTDWIIGDTTYYGYQPFWWIKLFNNSGFNQQLVARWYELREGALHIDSIFALIDSNAIFLDEAKERNFTKWNILGTGVWPNYFVGETHEEEIDYLKSWIAGRIEWIDESLGYNEIIEDTANKALIFPNPFQDEIRLLLQIEKASDIDFALFDISGKKIFEKKKIHILPTYHEIQINDIQIPNGFYIYQFKMNDSIFSHGKLIKQE